MCKVLGMIFANWQKNFMLVMIKKVYLKLNCLR